MPKKTFEHIYSGTEQHYNPYVERTILYDWSIVRYGQYVYIVNSEYKDDLDSIEYKERYKEWLCSYRYWKSFRMDNIELCKFVIKKGLHLSEEFYSGENRLRDYKELGEIY